jgi:hypothetical protein
VGGARARRHRPDARLRGSGPACSPASCGQDYGTGCTEAPDALTGYLLTGSAGSVAVRPGRLHARPRGPGRDGGHRVLVVAGRAAPGRQALRSGECDLALAGGVTVMSTPRAFVEFSPAARAGRGRAVQGVRRAADGTGWAEGAACWWWSGSPTRARNSGTGSSPWCAARRSTRTARRNGLTAPNGPSQQRVIRRRWPTPGSPPPTSTWSRRTAPAPAGRPDRGAGAAGHLRPGPGRRPLLARLAQVEHRPHPGRGGRRGRDQDGAGDAARRAAQDAARGRAVPARGLDRRRGASWLTSAPWPETGRPRGPRSPPSA